MGRIGFWGFMDESFGGVDWVSPSGRRPPEIAYRSINSVVDFIQSPGVHTLVVRYGDLYRGNMGYTWEMDSNGIAYWIRVAPFTGCNDTDGD